MAKGKTRRDSGKGKNAKQRLTRKTKRTNGGGYEEIGLHTPRGIEEIDIGQSFTAYPNLKYGEDHSIQESDLPDKHFDAENLPGEGVEYTLILSNDAGLRAHLTEDSINFDNRKGDISGFISTDEVFSTDCMVSGSSKHSYFSLSNDQAFGRIGNSAGDGKGNIRIWQNHPSSIITAKVSPDEAEDGETTKSEQLFKYDTSKGDMVIYAPQAKITWNYRKNRNIINIFNYNFKLKRYEKTPIKLDFDKLSENTE
jgi:hypothetical protein